MDDAYDIELTVSFIRRVGAVNVALQFPDELLREAPGVVEALRAALQREPGATEASLAILGDTSYGSCCVDEVAAAHMPADAIIHYGHSCHSAPASLPVFFVFGRSPLDAIACVTALSATIRRASEAGRRVLLVWDSAFTHAVPDVLAGLSRSAEPLPTPPKSADPFLIAFESPLPEALVVPSCLRAILPAATAAATTVSAPLKGDALAAEPLGAAGVLASGPTASPEAPEPRRVLTVAGLSWSPPSSSDAESSPAEGWEEAELASLDVFYIGARAARARALLAVFAGQDVWQFDPCSGGATLAPAPPGNGAKLISGGASRLMARRYRNVEVVKDANIVGIVVSTLGAARHNALVAALRAAVKRAGKGCYVLALGRLSPHKLANFPEIDAFVLVACPETTLMPEPGAAGGPEFFKPVVSPYEALVALEAGPAWTGRAVLDFGRLLAATTDEDTAGAAAREGGRVTAAATWAAADGDHAADGFVDAEGGGGQQSGGVVKDGTKAGASSGGACGAVVAHASHAAEYFKTQRRWQGLEYELPREEDTVAAGPQQAAATSADPAASTALILAESAGGLAARSTAPREGQFGRAAGYASEPSALPRGEEGCGNGT